jgi:hypothetical protein
MSRMSPVASSASAAVNSENVAIGTVMVVASADQFGSQVVGVLSKATAILLQVKSSAACIAG